MWIVRKERCSMQVTNNDAVTSTDHVVSQYLMYNKYLQSPQTKHIYLSHVFLDVFNTGTLGNNH